eukprot:CAMPEP_0202359124 /NCGR_PEP_ID=MMETSP1126-20121109/12530_1 /ASSEMBLY_ACC=CAM_ASM_000457 /TAXON_ID=3047 /ORGANISM="Dunaliella tertiolecta, Strain CCMP1320" /LENGTH=431 /DNA_ID=CAMNT_0048952449 /DNA_START=103 /DNA_END=1399 /DNA_ORIENTATION=-
MRVLPILWGPITARACPVTALASVIAGLDEDDANAQITRFSRPKLLPWRKLLRRCKPAMASAAQQAPLSQAKYSAELAAAADAVRLASRVCETVQRDLAESEKVDKQDDSPVTVADYAAQAVVAWSLSRSQAATQGTRLCMVAEEDSSSFKEPGSKPMLDRITSLINDVVTKEDSSVKLSPEDVLSLIDLGASEGGPRGRHWVLDPIDGTRGFVGMRQYAVCLGMLQDGQVELGVLGCPNLPQGEVKDEDGGAGPPSRGNQEGIGCLFLAHKGAGAYKAALYGARGIDGVQRIGVHDFAEGGFANARFMESYESRHSDHSFTASVADHLGVTMPPLRMDSQVKYGLLSRGEASIFMRFPPPTYREKIWDHCAGFVIVEEAGGRVTDASGKRLDFSKGRYLELDRGIVAAPPTVHTALLSAVAAVQKAQAAL